ncbi:hypothetical protein I3760_15G037800 [Carya illinoinensis]|nr:hypothetical protein I3760_15G037800 [Carya illinoinensis]
MNNDGITAAATSSFPTSRSWSVFPFPVFFPTGPIFRFSLWIIAVTGSYRSIFFYSLYLSKDLNALCLGLDLVLFQRVPGFRGNPSVFCVVSGQNPQEILGKMELKLPTSIFTLVFMVDFV